MAMSNKKILEEIEKGHILISPFKRENLSTSSYDVTLGECYYKEQHTLQRVYNPYSKEEVDRIWGKPTKAQKAKDVLGEAGVEMVNIGNEEQVILLGPGETILAHTNEFIGGKDHITTMMKARSSLGRNFIEVCKCAGWGDVGFTNRWTMEITNNAQNYFIPLVVGRRIAQIVFFETGQLEDGDDYTKKGKYQTSTDMEELKKAWRPEEMLPKMYNDRDIKSKN